MNLLDSARLRAVMKSLTVMTRLIVMNQSRGSWLMRTNGLTDYIKRNFIEKLQSFVCPNFTASVVEKSHKKAPEATWQEFTSKEFRAAARAESNVGH